jgi:SAM-dependent methyltransferase
MSRKKAIHAHYEPRISPDREHHEILDWADSASQQARFEALIRHVDLAGKSLLDVGCGLGDLWAFCQKRRIPVDYTGVDLIEKMVAAARQKHPAMRFVHADVFADNPFEPGSFAVVFCSGTFNLRLGNNQEFLAVALERLLEIARETVAFNLLHRRAAQRHGHCFYYDPDEVRRLLERFPCDGTIHDDYLPNDFTVICRKRPAGR